MGNIPSSRKTYMHEKGGRANNPAPPSQVQTLTLEAVLNQIEMDFNESLTNIRYRLAKLKEMMG